MFQAHYSRSGTWGVSMKTPAHGSALERRTSDAASAFGSLIRSRRKAMKMRQDQLALASGVGRRFLIELEAGKASCQLGRSLLVAEALGLRLLDILGSSGPPRAAFASDLPELPELPDELEAVE
jgi:transcriptional regulator with XRE-family HTH domain